MSGPPSDSLEAWSARLADGEPLDWEAARQDLSTESFERFRQLAELAGVMRRAADDEIADSVRMTRWGHLEIRGSLGRGSFGDVLLAFDPILQREVALKLRRVDAPTADPEAWIEEARQLARVRHPNVLAVHGADIQDGRPGLWADRIHGTTLRDHVRIAAPRYAEALRIARQLADAVGAVHAHGLVHGDIKPGNVMIEPDGRVVLMDFGSARREGGRARGAGSPAVMSPERLAGGPPSQADDVHALGAVFAFLARGRYPFEAGSVEDLQALHAQRASPDVDAPGMPAAWRRLVRGMLAPDPVDRPAIEQVEDRLERLRTAPARRRRLLALGTIFVLLTAGLATALTAYVRVRDAESETSAVNVLLRDVLVAPRATELGRDVRVVDVLERAVPEAERRFADRPLALARIRALVGQTYEALDLHDAAEPLLRRALATYADRLGPSHPRALDQLDPIARSENATGRGEEAEATWDRLLALADPEDPEMRHEMIYAHIGKAGRRLDENRTDAALAELDRAAHLHRDERTDRAAQSLHAMRALVLQRAGRADEAAVVGEQALEESLRVNGQRHVNTLIARDRLIQIQLGRGAMEAAEALARANLETTEAWLGHDERRTWMAQLTLSNVLADRGQTREALELLEAAGTNARRNMGADDPDLLVVESNRAARLLELGRYREGAEVAERVAAGYRSIDRAVGPLAWINGLNLAEARIRLDEFEAALAGSAAIHQDIVEAHGPRHPLARVAESYRGAALGGLGRIDEALPLLASSHDALAGMMGPDHPQVLLVEGWQAEMLWRSGRIVDARALIESAVRRADAALPAGHYRQRDLRQVAERVAADPPPASRPAGVD
ncbi:serine/threonine-protein kinase [Halomonas denitrificans]|nr:serine/threonine-protein kinase [Halomonas denitrificans]